MSKDIFRERLERMKEAQADYETVAATSVRELRSGSVTRVRIKTRRRHPAWDHLISLSLGIVLGCLAAAILIGLTLEASLWGPGTEWNAIMYYPAMGGLGLGPVLMVISLFVAARKPGFALFSLGYLTGLTISIFV